jgi:hypothetical protein
MSAYSNLILEHPDLLGYWPLQEGSGNAIDAAGAIDGVVTNVFSRAAAGPFPWSVSTTAYQFVEASNGVVLMANDESLKLTTGTIELWFKRSPATGLYGGIFFKGGWMGLQCENAQLACYSYGDGAMRNTFVGIVDGEWHHLALAFDDGVVDGSRFFHNGEPVLDAKLTGASHFTSGWAIANQYNGVVFEGAGNNWVCEAAIYSSKLTDAVVLSHYEMGVNGPTTSGSKSIMPLAAARRRRG